MPQAYAGEDIAPKIDLSEDREPFPFDGATLVRWWFSKTREQAVPDRGPYTVVDGGDNSFVGGYFYAPLDKTLTVGLSGDYFVGTEVTLGLQVTTFCDKKITFLQRGLT